MTDHTLDESERIIADGLRAVDQMRERVRQIEKARDEQPVLLTKARADADEARGWSLIEEPWDSFVSALPAHNSDGKRTGSAIALPNLAAKEVFGARLAFDMLDCGGDFDRIDEVQSRYFSMVHGDTGQMFLLAMSALSTIAGLVMPQMLDEIETGASNYDTRVLLAEARCKAWSDRVDKLRQTPEGRVLDEGEA